MHRFGACQARIGLAIRQHSSTRWLPVSTAPSFFARVQRAQGTSLVLRWTRHAFESYSAFARSLSGDFIHRLRPFGSCFLAISILLIFSSQQWGGPSDLQRSALLKRTMGITAASRELEPLVTPHWLSQRYNTKGYLQLPAESCYLIEASVPFHSCSPGTGLHR